MVTKKMWIIVLAAALILAAGVLLFKFTSSQSVDYLGEDAAQFAAAAPVDPSK